MGYTYPAIAHTGGTPIRGRKRLAEQKRPADEPYSHIARRFHALALLRRGNTLQQTAALVGVTPRAVQKRHV
ncbi:helix-turn-helix domain-containing protein [Synechococcus sp. RC10A2]|uniref:helix-turn-helix domain-containing protein n=1 Tax=Synechococcus sp. RC10A2 TaxID=2964529 RepID=UPI0039C61E85